MRFLSVSLGIVLFLGGSSVSAQNAQTPPEAESLARTLRELQSQIHELQTSVRELREEAARYRAETIELRTELARGAAITPNSTREQPPAIPVQSSDHRLAKVEEDVQLLNSKVDEQYQTKVESASKYRVRVSGIALFNLFSNRGVVDSIDNPALAEPRTGSDSAGSFGGTLRQSILGLEVFGPQVAGARTSADVQVDFA